MNKLNLELTKRIANQADHAEEIMRRVFDMTVTVPTYLISGMCGNDYDMKNAFSGTDVRGKNRVLAGAIHAAWGEWFTDHQAWHLLLDRERDVTKDMQFADTYNRSLYSGVKALTPFTVHAATKFFNDHLAVTPERRAKWLNDVLDRTGKDYRNHCTEFKTKMTLRSLDHGYGTVANELARALYAVCMHLNIDFAFNSFYTELRNNRVVDGNTYTLVEGLDMTFENHANGNTTLRISKDLAAQLNALIA